MPIIKFLTYLQEANKKVTISAGGVILKDVHISFYSINADNSLMIHTREKHEVYLELDNFKEIAFDPIVLKAPAMSIDYCLASLDEAVSFIAYFFDAADKTIIAFHISSDQQ